MTNSTSYKHEYCSCDLWYSDGVGRRICTLTTQHLRNAKNWLLERPEADFDPITNERTADEAWGNEKLDQIEAELERREEIDRRLLRGDLQDIEWHE